MFINTASMYLGILDWLIEWLTTFLTWLIQWAIDILVTVFAELFYSIGAMLMRFADLVQLMFKRLAGLGTYWTVGSDGKTAEKTGDILLDLVTNKAVLQVFLALSLIAVVMVVAGSIIQVVRTEYTTEGSRNSKAGIMGQALKSLMLFFIVPLASVFGIYISSFLLKAIDTATNVSGSSTISGQIFVAAASESNKAKMGDGKGAFGGGNQVDYGAGWDWANGAGKSAIEALGINLSSITGQKHEQAAKLAILIDKAYAQSGGEDSVGGAHPGVDSWNVKYLNVVEVSKCYNIRNMNFIVLWFGGGLAFYMLLMAAFGMIMRLFKATVLFVVAPPVVGLMPLDGGNAFKQWRQKFIGSIISAYGTIVALNLLFLIIPILNNIYIFPNEYWYSAQNNFVHLLFTLVAMFMLKDSAKMISDIIGAEDAMGAGEGMAKKVGSAAVSTAMAVGTAGAGAAALGMKGVAMAGKLGGGIASKVSKGKVGKALMEKSTRLSNSAGAFAKNRGKSLLNTGKGYASKLSTAYTGHDVTKAGSSIKSAFGSDEDAKNKFLESGKAATTIQEKHWSNQQERAYLKQSGKDGEISAYKELSQEKMEAGKATLKAQIEDGGAAIADEKLERIADVLQKILSKTEKGKTLSSNEQKTLDKYKLSVGIDENGKSYLDNGNGKNIDANAINNVVSAKSELTVLHKAENIHSGGFDRYGKKINDSSKYGAKKDNSGTEILNDVKTEVEKQVEKTKEEAGKTENLLKDVVKRLEKVEKNTGKK